MFNLAYLNERDLQLENVNLLEDVPIISCGTGNGKTYYAVNELTGTLERNIGKTIGFTLMLVPTNSIKTQTIADYKNAIALDLTELNEYDSTDKRVRVACFATLVKYLADGNEVKAAPDLLILDEIDQIAKWSLCFKDNLLAWDWIFSRPNEMLVWGLSATPQLLTDYVETINFVDVTPNYPVRYKADKVRVLPHIGLSTYLKGFNPKDSGKAVIYKQSAKWCAATPDKYPNSAFLVSPHNKDKLAGGTKTLSDLMNAQTVADIPFGETTVRDYVLKHHGLPGEIDVIFINDAYLTGVNIHDEQAKHIICETVDGAAITQAIGRIRHDVETITVIYNFAGKDEFFTDLKRARLFFDGNPDIETWYLQEQYQIEKALSNGKPIDIDILTYKTGGKVKVNPFAKAIYEYRYDIYQALNKQSTAREYFDKLLRPHAKNGKVEFLTRNEARQLAHNQGKVTDKVIEPYLNRKLFKQDRNRLAEELELKTKKRITGKWNTVHSYLKECGYIVKDTDNKAINPHTGKRQRYIVIQK